MEAFVIQTNVNTNLVPILKNHLFLGNPVNQPLVYTDTSHPGITGNFIKRAFGAFLFDKLFSQIFYVECRNAWLNSLNESFFYSSKFFTPLGHNLDFFRCFDSYHEISFSISLNISSTGLSPLISTTLMSFFNSRIKGSVRSL